MTEIEARNPPLSEIEEMIEAAVSDLLTAFPTTPADGMSGPDPVEDEGWEDEDDDYYYHIHSESHSKIIVITSDDDDE